MTHARSASGGLIVKTVNTLFALLPVVVPFSRAHLAMLGVSAEWPWWKSVVWAILLAIALIQTSGWVYVAWSNVTGRFYDDVRDAFIAAGGFLIACITPALVVACVFGLYAMTNGHTPDPLRHVRGPWWFLLISKVASDVIAFVVARTRFRLLTR